MCTEIQKSVVRWQGGPWISALSLWIKQVVIHRGVFTQVSSPVINWAQGRLFTGLNPQKLLRQRKSRPRRGHQWLAQECRKRGNRLKQEKQTGTNGLSVDNEGLFTDTEAGKDPPQQVIRAECPGDLAQ